jgi:hypothetical protein
MAAGSSQQQVWPVLPPLRLPTLSRWDADGLLQLCLEGGVVGHLLRVGLVPRVVTDDGAVYRVGHPDLILVSTGALIIDEPFAHEPTASG